jgi:hypothetical protein
MVTNLSPVEIVESDCGATNGFNIEIQDSKHCNSLKHRYYFNVDINDWDEFNGDNNFIGKQLLFRSPITCATDNFAICQKCFGNYKNIASKYVGVLSGQYNSERLIQLSMSSFHTAGSATLDMDKDVKKFISDNLDDIVNYDDYSEFIFKKKIPSELQDKFEKIQGFSYYISDKIIRYNNVEGVENEDVAKVIKEVNELLNTQKDPDIIHVYSNLIRNILSVGDIYSSFVEVILCNLFVDKNDKVIRYCLRDGDDFTIDKKYNIKTVHNILSETLSVLYQPNYVTIQKLHNKLQNNSSGVSIFERIWSDSL